MKPNEKLTRLEEMKDSMEESLRNIDKVMEQQQMLIDVVESSDKAENFKDFCEQLKSQIEDLKSQKSTLLHRKDLLESLLYESKKLETSKLTIIKLLDLFGIFEEK